jgi:hypothetical protein
MTSTATGTFEIDLQPAPAELDGVVSRFEFRKTFHGDLQGDGTGVMLASGNPASGAAGYVAIEKVRGRLDDREGGFALQQLGMLRNGVQTLHYEVVPGSGDGELAGIAGTFQLTVEDDGTHRYELEYEV